MKDSSLKIADMLKDLIKINAVIATELVQLVENSSRLIHGGDVPEICKEQHHALKKEIIEIAEKWSDTCQTLRIHNLDHE
ncbi:MAG: hypothetical protein HGJ94_14995 [Desulfosarcina sp.]|nr:hypothetical protein [Desulfosarcina sp.]MBC2741846.1 hypothetical protein [Desulfosarcina sp.]MBC2764759.1 hypothetical protein [Desulfosarcina sp.]